MGDKQNIKLDHRKVELYIFLLKIPQKIEKVEIKCIVKSSYNDNIIETLVTCNHSQFPFYVTTLFPSKDLFNIQSFQIDFTAEIVNIYDQNNTKIDKSAFAEYGIIG